MNIIAWNMNIENICEWKFVDFFKDFRIINVNIYFFKNTLQKYILFGWDEEL